MIDTLYYGDHHHHRLENASFEFSTDVLATFLRRIYNGFDTSNDFEPTMWREILRIINEGTVEGLIQSTYNVSHEKKFLQSLAHSNEVFSAFKVHDMGVDMAKKLKTSDGKLKSFAEWKKDVAPIATHYCGSWLQTEYNTAVLRGHFAAEWKQYEADKDIMPNLRWMPTTSATPDEEHKAYWMNRLTLPVDDKFWNNHHPGDHWNCKCTLEQTDDPSNPEVLGGVKDVKAQPGLKTNPGKSGVMYDQSHPYFAESCAKCPFYGKKGLKNVFSNVEKHCENCESIDKCMDFKKKVDRARAKVLKKEASFLVNTILRNDDFPHDVVISKAGIKEWLNQPHKHYSEKNELILKLEQTFKEAKYLYPIDSNKSRPDVDSEYLFETSIGGDPSWIIVHHMKWGEYRIHSVTDSENIKKGKIKEQ